MTNKHSPSRRIVAVIPARGGSRRIPEKNIARLAGKPLIAYTIQAALKSRYISETYLSTDCARIAATARAWGAAVIDRPAQMATSTSPTEPALIHAAHAIETNGPSLDAVVMLQPTSPLRGHTTIDGAIELFLRSGCDAVASVSPDVSHYFLGDIGEDGRFVTNYDPKNRLRTQDVPPRHRENGAIYVTARDFLVTEHCRMGGDTRAYVMDDSESIDIDTLTDLRHCEAILAGRSAARSPTPAVDEMVTTFA